MKVDCIYGGYVGNNSYLVSDNGKVIVIDPASAEVYTKATQLNLNIAAVLLTHGHYDHIAGVQPFIDANVPIYIHEGDVPKCSGIERGEYLEYYGITPFSPTHTITEDCTLNIDGIEIEVVTTPGHSRGSVCYIIGNIIFSGDTLFSGSYGRYDFTDGSYSEIRHSLLGKLFALDGDYKVYAGHGEATTLDTEREENMILWS